MTQNHKDVFWRGIAESGCDSVSAISHRERILVLVGASGNRKQLVEHLKQRYQVIFPDEPGYAEGMLRDNPAGTSFDLAIVDLAGALRWHRRLAEARSHAQPVFLPAMLITSRKDLPRAMQTCDTLIDEFLLTPIEPNELTQRVAMLLRARRQALTQSTRLAYLTSHDQGSGLPNKTLFLDRLSQAIQDATVLGRKVFALTIHISLASVLKSLGNRALEEAGLVCCERLKAILGDNYSLARLATEEWALMLRAGASTKDVLEVFRSVQQLTATPLDIRGERVHISPNVGIAVYPDDAANASSLLDCAGAALARTERVQHPMFYSSTVQRQALAQIRTEAGLHEALAFDQFELWFQPKVNLKNRSLSSVEALIRWRLPSGDLVPPNNFIPLAEHNGLITCIDRWVLNKACESMQLWQTQGGPAQVAVNISAQHLVQDDFLTTIEQTLSHYDVPPTALELELTETALADLGQESLDKLWALRKKGVSIALDDFGTGYCSLNYIHKLPITTLKIDKCFIDNIVTDSADTAVTQTIVSLAKNFRLKLVAEGIETEEQCERLVRLQVETGQGYLFARPMPFVELQQWIGIADKLSPRDTKTPVISRERRTGCT
ncbi:EAL domain-containing protein (putative c-di-GMP-specific phosphodiesterase class I) [Modicisalibacter xianhensis]|uniref:EAL domain-containing protein (Putative c-di-GMP-specific phosphodiesterase class I) n=1 Tax=Modicisalibacter xianhensis TaxID=442341 RepID=A0A4R8FFQ1_9GAMM|nr:EAL domain-containing protein [Halomonas xianhensis]TDX24794.1 EAL domain-containing protein (putative c-di-GMP-specific phosphodiesterase class I) [Halomonas xianhensis]